MIKKVITLILIVVIMISSTITYAVTTKSLSDWNDSLAKLKLMGVVEESDLNINGKITRAEFSKVIVNSTGNYDLAISLAGSTTFSDVSTKLEYCGYINAAVNKGFLSAYSDGKFKPSNPLSFAQLCTAMIKALGYTSSDIVGAWPNGYLEKAKSLGLTTGFSLKSNDAVATSAAIIMIERMLDTNIKKANAQDEDKTLKDSVGLMDDQTNWVYSEPEVAFNFNANTKKLGNITFDPNIPILRDKTDNTVTPVTKAVGEIISLRDIKDKDVVYEVYNKLNVLMYYLVIDNKIVGNITSILPSKYSPTKIQIGNVDYDLGEYAEINKFNSTSGSFSVEDEVCAVLGYDGKVIDAYYSEDENNQQYAFVTDWTSKLEYAPGDYGKPHYTVELLHVDGTKETYDIDEKPEQYDNKLVTYTYLDEDEETVALQSLTYTTSSEVTIDTAQRIIDHRYATDNIKIFNCTDSPASIIKWSDIPNGTLPAGKILYMGTIGDFEDVNILLLYDINNVQNKDFVVQRYDLPDGRRTLDYSYYMRSGGTDYTYKCEHQLADVEIGSVVNMKMGDKNTIDSFNEVKNPDNLGWVVNAIDENRIKINNWVFAFTSDVSIYIVDYSGNLSVKKISDIDVNYTYGSVKMYCDRPLNNGGKVQTIVISMK